MKTTKPYGGWESKLSANLLASRGKRFGQMQLDNGALYWLEVRASEQGRGVIVKSSNGKLEEVLPKDISVRSRVHEYGGGDFIVRDDVIYFSNAKDDRIYKFKDGSLKALTPICESINDRFADFDLHPNGQCLVAVRERHTEDNQVINDLVSIAVSSENQQQVTLLHTGYDFYSYPRFEPNGERLCWTCWEQPDMPWDSTELWVADWQNNKIAAAHIVTGGNGDSIFQPSWDQNGNLHYVSNTSGWANLYVHINGVLNALTPIDRDFAMPQWIFAQGSYVIQKNNNNAGDIYALYFENGEQNLCHIDENTGHIEPVDLPFSHFEGQLLVDDHYLYFCAASPTVELAMYRYHLQSKKLDKLTQLANFVLPEKQISVAEGIHFNSNDKHCHAFFYKPVNSEFDAPKNTLPPLIVISHGGPTGATNNALSAEIQFWTNRGFAVVDVNYSGSTGFGKKYQQRLNGNWGIYDVEDCIAATEFLVAENKVDKNKLLIRGGSAGGYTTLCALTFHDIFTAGMSRYGVSDLEALANECHKFEGRYTDNMVGPLPQSLDIYKQRSPIYHTDKLSCPILLLQGSDDKVVPPNQSQMLADALDEKRIPHAYLLFEGEGHGFRQAETIIKAFNTELYFYQKILGIIQSSDKEEVEIKHLK